MARITRIDKIVQLADRLNLSRTLHFERITGYGI